MSSTTPKLDGAAPAAPVAVPVAPAAEPVAPAAPVDSVERARRPRAAAPASRRTLKRIPESFPIDALSKLEARGLAGQTFMLDAGSVRGLSVRVRRVDDGGTRGFEMLLQLNPAKLPALMAALEARGAERTGFGFRGAELGEDGIARFAAGSTTLTAGNNHQPTDLDRAHDRWVYRLSGARGGTIEVVHDKAALALRGMVRIELRGDDRTCTQQLQQLVNDLGLQHLLAPPSANAKERHRLLRALWQLAPARAEELARADLDHLAAADLADELEAAGVTPERIRKLRYEEVFDGHFTVVDPLQTHALMEAGARYLYSSVKNADHVATILGEGMKSSLRRYREGTLVNGMSTMADFSTGGAVGVFARLVTQDAIYDGGMWSGYPYRVIFEPTLLARTDWYGWNSDKYGRRWELGGGNFGAALVKSVDEGGYKSTNEVIFSDGIPASAISCVVAHSEQARQELLAALRARGLTPSDDFVRVAPRFIPIGAPPFDMRDPAAFAADALARARAGDTARLRCFLVEGPLEGGHRARLEQELLADPELRKLALKAFTCNGRFTMDNAALERVLAAQTPEALQELVRAAPAALLRSRSDAAVAALAAAGGLYLDGETWAGVCADLIASEPAGARSKALAFALEQQGIALIEQGHVGVLAALENKRLIGFDDRQAWARAQLDSPPATDLALYLGQTAKPEDVAWLQELLVRTGTPEAVRMLRLSLKRHGTVAFANVRAVLESLPLDSAARKELLDAHPDLLLRSGDAGTLALVESHWHGRSPDFDLWDTKRWFALVEHLSASGSPILHRVLERGCQRLMSDPERWFTLLASLPLFEVADPAAFAEAARAKLPQGGMLELMWMLSHPSQQAARTTGIAALLRAPGYEPRQVLELLRQRDPAGELPVTDDELRALVHDLHAAEAGEGLDWLMGSCGVQLLSAADAALLPVLEQRLGENDLSAMGLYGASVVTALEALDTRADGDAGAVRAWVLRRSAKGAFAAPDLRYLAYLRARALGLDDLGLDAKAAAELVHGAVSRVASYLTNPEHASSPWVQPYVDAADWLLDAGSDEAVLAALEAGLREWRWSPEVLAAIAARCSLPEPWVTRLQAAAAPPPP